MPVLFITLEVRPDIGDPDVIYTQRKVQPVEWISDPRYFGYLKFEFEEMLREMQQQTKGLL